MEEKVLSLKKAFQKDLKEIAHSKDLEQLKIKYLGKKGPIASLMLDLRNVDPEQRPRVGKAINELKKNSQSFANRRMKLFFLLKRQSGLKKKKLTSPFLASADFWGGIIRFA